MQKDASASFNAIEDSGINAKFVNAVYDALLNTPQDIQKTVLKGIINSLLREWKGPRTKDDLRAYFILLQQSLVDKVSRRQRPDMNMLFLNMKVRRTHLVSDSLDEVSIIYSRILTRKRADLKKKLKVTFVGEAGLDMGGLTKEWFLLLIRQIFHPDYGE
ncbi:hypothetical protein J1605_021825 [Eschrichtius robustus]|uniref:HECT-type E3 ubiquitin transferase n=1 Tax=Eschrichtius robustus TaxID=9764 RepID=A0AB34HDF1_ESCRO|nr:hypothetical protein J1605_021825 [Eschrichtius robustus]